MEREFDYKEKRLQNSGLKSKDECAESWLEEFVSLQENITVKDCDTTFPDLDESGWSQRSFEWSYATSEEVHISDDSYGSRGDRRLLKLNKPYLPPQLIEKRNARERKRVKDVNAAFAKLRQVVPSVASHSKHVSKVKTLKKAVEYIAQLKKSLDAIQQCNDDYDNKRKS